MIEDVGESKVFPGVYRAVVTDAEDPLDRGRVQIEIPSLSEEGGVWAPMLRQAHDSLVPPEPGDEVIVAFEEGDPASPLVLGMLWSSRGGPPE